MIQATLPSEYPSRARIPALVIVAVLMTSGPWAWAQPESTAATSSADIEKAKQLFQSAEAHKRKGDELSARGDTAKAREEYGLAAKDYLAGYKLSKLPLFLYNLGSVYRLRDNKQWAISCYRIFIDTSPDNDKDANDALTFVAELEQDFADNAETAEPDPSIDPAGVCMTKEESAPQSVQPTPENKAVEVPDAPTESNTKTTKADATPVPSRGLRLSAGIGLLARSLSFTSRQDLDAPPYEYSSDATKAARIQGEIYPTAVFGSTGLFSLLGVSFAFESALGSHAQIEGLGVRIPITHQRWELGLRYRIPLGVKYRNTTLTIEAGYGWRKFYFDRTALMDTTLEIDAPDVDYRMFKPGLAISVPVHRRVELYLCGAYLLIREVGDIDDPEWYGRGTAFGINSEFGATMQMTSKLFLHAGLHYMRVDFDFLGNGAKSDRDNDGISDVDSAVDEFYGGHLTAELRF